jgi:hypothetical protein
MKKQNIYEIIEEDNLLENKWLNENERYLLSYLKGFNRKNLREWNRIGLIDFNVDLTN